MKFSGIFTIKIKRKLFLRIYLIAIIIWALYFLIGKRFMHAYGFFLLIPLVVPFSILLIRSGIGLIVNLLKGHGISFMNSSSSPNWMYIYNGGWRFVSKEEATILNRTIALTIGLSQIFAGLLLLLVSVLEFK